MDQYAQATASVEREHFLLQHLIARRVSQNDFIRAFLKPPLFSLGYEHGFGTCTRRPTGHVKGC